MNLSSSTVEKHSPDRQPVDQRVPAQPAADTQALDTLLDDPRSLVRLRILRAARLLIAERGLSVSMEEIAAAADMGRRTMFRYFDSHEDLIAAALASALDWYDQQVEMGPDPDASLESWLTNLVSKIHRIHQTAGLGLRQLAASEDVELSPQLAAVNERRRTSRQRTTAAIARSGVGEGWGFRNLPSHRGERMRA